eukprot:2182509-Alexandrium_andersonii.AAC.1
MVAGQAAFQATCRLRTAGPGPKGTTALPVETRPADDSGRPVGRKTLYVSAGKVDAGAWLGGREQSFGRCYVRSRIFWDCQAARGRGHRGAR